MLKLDYASISSYIILSVEVETHTSTQLYIYSYTRIDLMTNPCENVKLK